MWLEQGGSQTIWKECRVWGPNPLVCLLEKVPQLVTGLFRKLRELPSLEPELDCAGEGHGALSPSILSHLPKEGPDSPLLLWL